MTAFQKTKHTNIFGIQNFSEKIFVYNEKNKIEEIYGLTHQKTKDGHYSSIKSVISKKVIFVLTACSILSICLLLGRSIQIQIVKGDRNFLLASQNRFQKEITPALRGKIYERNGELLAWNEPSFAFVMTPSKLSSEQEERSKIFLKIAEIVGLNPLDLELKFANGKANSQDTIIVLDEISHDAAMRLAVTFSNFKGFDLIVSPKRIYKPGLSSLSHIIGYTGLVSENDILMNANVNYRPVDKIGKTGVEQWYETELRGEPGSLTYEVDAKGKKLNISAKEDSVQGKNLFLCIDENFQKFITTSLESVLNKTSSRRGSVIAIEPTTGKVRAMVSLPTFDSNEFSSGISSERYSELLNNEDKPLFQRAIAGEFPSGSIFKPIVAYAALAEGIVNEHTSFLSTGGVRIGQWFFPDWKTDGHGVTDVRKAIAESVNTFFYIIGGGLDNTVGLGVDRIDLYAKKFGFGEKTGIDLPGESDGFLPTKEWKETAKNERWYVGDTYHLAIGQGDFLTTPLQMAVATSVFANCGYLVAPRIVEGEVMSAPIEELNSDAVKIVREGMRAAVTNGSARALNGLSKSVAGKTGTAQTPGNKPYHSWFTGFAPYNDPTITVVVLVEEGGESTDAAVPLAKDIFEWWFLHDN